MRSFKSWIFLQTILLYTFLAGPLPAKASAQSDTNEIRALFFKAMDFQDYNNDSAWLYAKRGFEESKKVNYKVGMGMAFMRFGALMNAKGKSDSALLYFRQALSIRKELKNHKGVAAIYQQISYVHRNLGNRDSSFFYMYESLRQYDAIHDSVGIAKIYIELATLFTTYENFVQALLHLEKAKPIVIKQNDPNISFQLYAEYGTMYFHQSKNREALYYFLKAKKCNEEIANPVFEANNNNQIGLCHQELGNSVEALKYFQKSLQSYIELELPHETARLYFNIGNLYVNIRQAQQGIAALKQSLQVAKTVNDQDRILRCYEILADAYAQLGDYFQAYQNFQAFTTLSDSLLNSAKVSEIAKMQVQYDTEKKLQQIKLLDAENKSKETQGKFMIAIIVIISVSALGIGFGLLQRSKIAHKKEQLALQEIKTLITEQEARTYDAMLNGQEEERKRIANDLHDRLGGMLSTVKLLFSGLESKIDRGYLDQEQQYSKANHLLDEACVEVRRISHNLSTSMVSTFGLLPAMEELVDGINSSQIMKAKLLSYGMHDRLDNQIEIGLYRIAQEVIQNILKHAAASNVQIQINKTEDSVLMTIEDDGKGFNVAEKKQSGGLGLASIDARAKKMMGTYHIDSTIGKGTISIIEIPLIDIT